MSGTAHPIDSTTTQVADGDSSLSSLQPLTRRIILTGFMGAGKTTVGRLLADQLGWAFNDADQVIEASEGASIAALFAQHGEPWFRELEHKTIHRLLNQERMVLALGGGAIEDERTRSLLLESTGSFLIHLEASLDTVLVRCHGTEAVRPILQDQTHLEGRYRRRLPLYRQAHLTVPVDSLLPENVVTAILGHIRMAE